MAAPLEMDRTAAVEDEGGRQVAPDGGAPHGTEIAAEKRAKIEPLEPPSGKSQTVRVLILRKNAGLAKQAAEAIQEGASPPIRHER